MSRETSIFVCFVNMDKRRNYKAVVLIYHLCKNENMKMLEKSWGQTNHIGCQSNLQGAFEKGQSWKKKVVQMS